MTPTQRPAFLVDRSDRTRIVVAGPDRGKLLHNLTTNDFKRLEPGRGREAFLTSPQGKIVAYLIVHHAGDETLLVRADPDAAGAILPHLAKHGVFEEATHVDLSATTTEFHLAAPDEGGLAAIAGTLGVALPTPDLGVYSASVAGIPATLIRESPAGAPGLTVIVDRERSGELRAILDGAVTEAGGSRIEPGVFDAYRIAAGTPRHGRDLTANNLPQEANRDGRAISFVKGCYLGQETVARLDALGHVNKILFLATVEGGIAPPPGTPIRPESEGDAPVKDVGVVTSSAAWPGSEGRSVLLGIAKVANVVPGTRLVASSEGKAIELVVAPWPIPPG